MKVKVNIYAADFLHIVCNDKTKRKQNFQATHKGKTDLTRVRNVREGEEQTAGVEAWSRLPVERLRLRVLVERHKSAGHGRLNTSLCLRVEVNLK